MRLFKLISIITLISAFSICAWAEHPPEHAGETTLVLGKALLSRANGEQIQLSRGVVIFNGDRIETASNGHVHIKFVDDALLSVRPNSVLEVQEYRYDASQPQKSTVKINLEEGVTRSISGKASKAARDRFRLNTPVAAIGVRGTDFVVGADSRSTKALVSEGAIVMSPFSSTCLIEGLGPCANDGLELARDGLRLISYQSGDPAPILTTSQSLSLSGEEQLGLRSLLSAGNSVEETESASLNSDSTSSAASPGDVNEVYLEAVTSPVVRTGAGAVASKVASTDFTPTEPIVVSVNGQVEQFDHTPPKRLTTVDLRERQLVWGHYGDSPDASSDRVALSFQDAAVSRKATVGTLGFGLFRKDASPRRVASDLGLVGFQLASAQATFNSETGIAVMRVTDGSLEIDFPSRSFETMLSLAQETIGAIEFSAGGRIFDGGILRALDETQRLAGAVSYDGSEAGYFFEKQLNNGLVTGLTLWNNK